MALEPIHVMEMDRSTSRLELTHINPTRQYMAKGDNGFGLIHWQNGHYYDTGGNEMDAAEVPQYIKDDIARNPVVVQIAGTPSVAATCRLCGEAMNSGQMEEHLLAHVERTMQLAGTAAQATEVPPPLPEKRDANRHAKE